MTEEETLINLPPELERVIFELAAWLYPSMIQTLILVAKRVWIWIEPQLYHVVLCDGGETQLLIKMLEYKSPEFLQAHVRHLALSSSTSRDEVTRILSICTNICDLALWTGDTYPAMLPLLRNLTSLKCLSINLYSLFGGPENFQIPPVDDLALKNLTHLDVFSDIPEPLWPFFGMLPSLTHLSLSDFTILAWWTWYSTLDMFQPSDTADPRLCSVSCQEFRLDWIEGAWGRCDYWRRAESMVEKRRSRGLPWWCRKKVDRIINLGVMSKTHCANTTMLWNNGYNTVDI
ncbi:hypothetical protein R3P38DRAFT_3329379 [Favolaschia claudopus]|uniref:F-box domain-containing protein n=1 Tax=Favolaschia claudopus TaxID=2862362 RepID=A0AAV9ZZR4_9AGAR